MNTQELFDTLTIRFTDVVKRRDVLRLVARLALAMLVFEIFPWRVMAQEVESESNLVQGCRLYGQKCNNGKRDCCSKKCNGQGRCDCLNKGAKPIVDTPLGPVPVKALCCSNKLNKRRGTCR